MTYEDVTPITLEYLPEILKIHFLKYLKSTNTIYLRPPQLRYQPVEKFSIYYSENRV